MKDKLVVAAVQMSTHWLAPKENLEYMKDAIAKAKTEMQADLVVFPELSNIGYIKERDKEFGKNYIKCAERFRDPLPMLWENKLKSTVFM